MGQLDEFGGWSSTLNTLIAGRDLASGVVAAMLGEILSGEATAAQIAAVLVALRAKGETASELSAMLDVVLKVSQRVELSASLRDAAVDIVGTGGDGSHSINISTMAAIVAAGAGVPVCKHGNRAASSSCGTADVLEALGVRIDLDPAGVAACVAEAGIGFCFAPSFHPAFRFAAPARREIGVPTAFNLLGPMANPGGVTRMVIGVADPTRADLVLDTLAARGTEHAWVVHGGGLDELTTTGPSEVHALRRGEVKTFSVDPTGLGLATPSAADLVGGDPAHNAAAVRAVLSGEVGPHRDIVILNAAAALVVADRAIDLAEGLELAVASIDSGSAAARLEDLISVSNRDGLDV